MLRQTGYSQEKPEIKCTVSLYQQPCKHWSYMANESHKHLQQRIHSLQYTKLTIDYTWKTQSPSIKQRTSPNGPRNRKVRLTQDIAAKIKSAALHSGKECTRIEQQRNKHHQTET